MGASRKRKNEVDISHLKNSQVLSHHTTECLRLMHHGMDQVVSSHTASSSSALTLQFVLRFQLAARIYKVPKISSRRPITYFLLGNTKLS